MPEFIALDVKPSQVSKTMRQLATDNGEGTILQIERTFTYVIIRIIQYDAAVCEQKRSNDFRLRPDDASAFITCHLADETAHHWAIRGDEGKELNILKSQFGDVELWITDPKNQDSVFNVPKFSQIASGGKSRSFRYAIHELVHILKACEMPATARGTVICYAQMEELYHSIGEEKFFVIDY